MKKINLEISSTSFLFNNHKIWEEIKKKYNLDFNDYGKLYNNNNNKDDNKINVNFFFLIDVIDYPANKINQNIIKNTTQLIEQKIKNNQEVFFFTLSGTQKIIFVISKQMIKSKNILIFLKEKLIN